MSYETWHKFGSKPMIIPNSACTPKYVITIMLIYFPICMEYILMLNICVNDVRSIGSLEIGKEKGKIIVENFENYI